MVKKSLPRCTSLCVCIDFKVKNKSIGKQLEKEVYDFFGEYVKSKSMYSQEYFNKLGTIDQIISEDGSMNIGMKPHRSNYNTMIKLRKYQKAKRSDLHKKLNEYFNILEKHEICPTGGQTCGIIEFDSNIFMLSGGLSLPKAFSMPQELETKIGNPTLTGFGIDFKDSPIGLDYMAIESDDSKITIMIRTTFAVEKMKDIINNSYKQLNEITKMFVEKRV